MRHVGTIVLGFAPAGFAPARTLALRSTTDAATVSMAYRRPPESADADRLPNEVVVWNRILLGILNTPGAQPATVHPTRNLAMMHLAIADAVGAISRRFAPYGFELVASPYASQPAAAASAAHEVLVALYPAMKPALDAELARSLQLVRVGSGRTAGIAVGVRAGRAILRLHQNDGSSAAPEMLEAGIAPGERRLTAPGLTQPVFTQWSAVTPFLLQRASQFRPGPPPPVGSETYASALAEVRSLGAHDSLTRSPDQTEIGRFWSAPIQNFWNEITQTVSLAHHYSVADDARLFASLNASFADEVIATYDAKYAYGFWRPASAVENDGMSADAEWAALVETAADPSYPDVHSVLSLGAATILGHEFGDRFDFDVGSTVLPGVRRNFSSFGAAALEAGLSRIYAGDQFRFDHAAGNRLGRRVADYALEHGLRLKPSVAARC
jgi:PAP2 superfamily